MQMRLKELIAIGASVAANCQGCLEYHVGKARENGAEEDEIQQAIGVGKVVRKGAAGKMDQYAAGMCGGTAGDCTCADDPGGCQLT